MNVVLVIIVMLFLFISCNNEKEDSIELTPDEAKEYLDLGEAIVKESFDSLQTNIIRAIKETGIKGALKYCSLNAHPIIYHLEKKKNVKIRRASQKFRNPANQPDSMENSIIDIYADLLSKGEKTEPIIRTVKKEIHYFKPIIVKDLCLNCHGKVGEEITEENYKVITELYPLDNATGYKQGDLRGIWHIVAKYTKK
ncbi:MAG: DUF3365 domain-containing protein [Candidatus Kapabacteria bacterium]|nr:DUF3365 domain-containing protein [Candidatus Kapabacteria bacterium]